MSTSHSTHCSKNCPTPFKKQNNDCRNNTSFRHRRGKKVFQDDPVSVSLHVQHFAFSFVSAPRFVVFVLPIVWQHGFFLSILWMSFLLDEFCHKLGTHIAFDCCQITGNYWYPHQPHLYSLLRYGYKILAWQHFYRPQEPQKVKRKKSKSVWLKFLWQHGLKPAAVKLITDPTLCNLRYISETVLYILL